MPRQVDPERVARLQRRFLRQEGATPQEIRKWRPYLTAQIGAESNFTKGLTSGAGASGIAQFMPGTAASYGVNPHDSKIKDDIRGQVRYMLPLLREHGVEGALRGYNAGPGAIEASKGYSETNKYVERIFGSVGQYRGGDRALPGGGQNPLAGNSNQAPGASVVGRSGFPLDPSRAGGLAQLLGLLDDEPAAPVSSTPLPGPMVTGRSALALPEGFQAVESGPPAQPEQDKLQQALSLVESLGADLPEVLGPSVVGGGGKQPGSRGRGNQGSGGSPTIGGGTAKGIGSAIEAIAREAGWPIGSGQRSASENAAVGGASDSDHLVAAGRYARDFPIAGQENIEAAGKQVARQLGIKYQGGDTVATIKVGDKRFRVQIITRPHGTGPHLHVGLRRLP